ncbi:MAG: peptidoglycan DD-metalloendopeptidase family protein [Prevotella sp.]|nr:peptidoglycan DD-metalloendopeptidase family protein [Prevotella sp.]
MYLRRPIRTFIITAFLACGAVSASAQDLLARQAPIDKKMKAVDTLALRDIINKEESASPSAMLYKEWSNKYAHQETEMPDSFLINLRNFCMPTTSRVITSNFGKRWGRAHKGLDIKVYIGDTIRAAFSGKVRIVRYEARGYGNYVVIRHYNGLETIYGHMSKQLVQEDQEVKAGDPIGLGGNTGRSTGSHLHFETRLCGVALNPAIMFDFKNQDVTGDSYMYRKSTYEHDSELATRINGVDGSGNASASSSSSSSRSKSDVRYHKVQKGETLSSIARKRHVTVDKLCKLNRLKKTSIIRQGQILRYS